MAERFTPEDEANPYSASVQYLWGAAKVHVQPPFIPTPDLLEFIASDANLSLNLTGGDERVVAKHWSSDSQATIVHLQREKTADRSPEDFRIAFGEAVVTLLGELGELRRPIFESESKNPVVINREEIN